MKVLLQEWETEQGYQVSLSKDQEQLHKTIVRLEEKDAGEPMDEPLEIEIPDDHVLARIVERETVFILQDEREAGAYLH